MLDPQNDPQSTSLSSDTSPSSECAPPVVEALGRLLKACRTRPESPDGGVESLIARLATFPEPVALAALRRWPETQHGAFVPTEHDLYELCSTIAAQERARAAVEAGRAETGAAGRYGSPVGASARAVRRMQAMDAPFVRAWLKTGVNVQFRDAAILTTSIGFEKIAQRFADVLDEEGVALIACPQVRHMLAKAAALAGNTPMPDPALFRDLPTETRLPRPRETPEERRAVASALRAAGLLRSKAEGATP
jgi:hypothetical protein